jgi:hypothetical protein
MPTFSIASFIICLRLSCIFFSKSSIINFGKLKKNNFEGKDVYYWNEISIAILAGTKFLCEIKIIPNFARHSLYLGC